MLRVQGTDFLITHLCHSAQHDRQVGAHVSVWPIVHIDARHLRKRLQGDINNEVVNTVVQMAGAKAGGATLLTVLCVSSVKEQKMR